MLPSGSELDLTSELPAGEAATADITGEAAQQTLALQARTAAFFDLYGGIFGVADFSQELSLDGTMTDPLGNRHLTYRQVYQGEEVFAGQLKVHFDPAGSITAVNGTFIPDLDLSTTPTLEASAAEIEAVNFVKAKDELARLSTGVNAAETQIMIFRQGLVQGIPGSNHLAYEVTVVDALGTVREYVYVDAQDGRILDHYTGIHQGLDRKVYERSISQSQLKWEEGDSFPLVAVVAEEVLSVQVRPAFCGNPR